MKEDLEEVLSLPNNISDATITEEILQEIMTNNVREDSINITDVINDGLDDSESILDVVDNYVNKNIRQL